MGEAGWRGRTWGGVMLGLVTAFVVGWWTHAAAGSVANLPVIGPVAASWGSDPEIERQRFLASRLTSPWMEPPGVRDGDPGLVRIRSRMVSYLDSASVEDPALRVGVYLRDLNDGPWIGIDERELFAPASLFKLPVLIHTLVRAEDDPALLQRTLVFAPGDDDRGGASAPEPFRLEPGTSYTYEELLRRLIAYSDNEAQDLLMTGVEVSDVQRVLALAQGGLIWIGNDAYLDAKSYAMLFRLLYGASFLDRFGSEYALDLLTVSSFHSGLRRHVPEEVTVASKFGYWEGERAAQLHECGIVYQPGRPYLLCVMTESGLGSLERLARILADLSRIAWEGRTGAAD